jgi:hypothetical protein
MAVEWRELVGEWVRRLLLFSSCEPLLIEAGRWGMDSSGVQSKGNISRWEPLPGNNCWRHSTCCSELQRVWISDDATVTYRYDL